MSYHSLLAFVHEDIGGYEGLVDKYFLATASIRASTTPNGTELCGEVPGDAMHLLRDASPGNAAENIQKLFLNFCLFSGKSDLPWSGMIFGLAISSIWYWLTRLLSRELWPPRT